MIRIPYPPFLTVERELAGNTTPTDPRSQRIRASRKGRPCNELGLSAQGLSAACPHLCAPDAPCPRWAHHNPLPRGSGGYQGAEIIMPDNGSASASTARSWMSSTGGRSAKSGVDPVWWTPLHLRKRFHRCRRGNLQHEGRRQDGPTSAE